MKHFQYVNQYILEMCSPFSLGYSSQEVKLSTLADSPFPCDCVIFIQQTCTLQGMYCSDCDSEAGHAFAVNECLCQSPIWELSAACDSCQAVRGVSQKFMDVDGEIGSAFQKSLCEPVATKNFMEILESVWETAYALLETGTHRGVVEHQAQATLEDDRAFSKTEVSAYFTG